MHYLKTAPLHIEIFQDIQDSSLDFLKPLLFLAGILEDVEDSFLDTL
ncbi:MAG: hypothetical protein HYS21_02745 [Deltaproteobacteria bacterium]|nr:hypothetical protein [Deltaproteobacteria bacterium]